jgi:diphthine-ammonia ligase
MEAAVLTSGGKDSIFSAYFMRTQGWDIKALIKVKPKFTDSYLFHTVNLDAVDFQGEVMGIDVATIDVEGRKEAEVEELKLGLRRASREHGFDFLVTGAIASEYQRVRFDRICDELGLRNLSPLWHKNPEKLLKTYLEEGFKFVFSGVYAMGLDSDWLGRIITFKDLEELVRLNKKYGVSIVGEGGEYESLVLDCPLFDKALCVAGIKKASSLRAEFLLKDITLVTKPIQPGATLVTIYE